MALVWTIVEWWLIGCLALVALLILDHERPWRR